MDRRTGKPLWSQSLTNLAACNIPEWGFTPSPLVANDLVIAINGARIESVDELQRELAFDSSATIAVSVLRDGKRTERDVKPEFRRAA